MTLIEVMLDDPEQVVNLMRALPLGTRVEWFDSYRQWRGPYTVIEYGIYYSSVACARAECSTGFITVQSSMRTVSGAECRIYTGSN